MSSGRFIPLLVFGRGRKCGERRHRSRRARGFARDIGGLPGREGFVLDPQFLSSSPSGKTYFSVLESPVIPAHLGLIL